MLKLFTGSAKAHGETLRDGSPKGKPATHDGPITPEVLQKHLLGQIIAGACPVDESGKCVFGVVDLDTHDDEHSVDLQQCSAFIESKGWPLLLCKTRRGGAHAILFLSEPTDARKMQVRLGEYAKELKQFAQQVETFPKQAILTEGNKGSWVHLPYSGASTPDLEITYCFFQGKRLDLDQFLLVANSRKVRLEALAAPSDAKDGLSIEGMPPCLQHVLEQKIADGEGRNNALVNFAIFLSRSGQKPGLLAEINRQAFLTPVDKDKLRGMAKRVGEANYQYMCSATPLCDHCDKGECQKRAFGIASKTAQDELGIVTGIEKHLHEEPVYYLLCAGHKIRMTKEELANANTVRTAIMSVVNKTIPLKQGLWEEFLNNLLSTKLQTFSAPAATGPTAQIQAMIATYLGMGPKTISPVENLADVRLHPVVIDDHLGRRVCICADVMLEWNKRRKTPIDPTDAWQAWIKTGGKSSVEFTQGREIEVWWRPWEAIPDLKFSEKCDKQEY